MRFDALATRAALGTTNRPLVASDLPDAVAATLPAEGAGEPAALLLDAAASYALARRTIVPAGPQELLDLPAPSRPEAPPTFVALLRRARAAGALRDPLTREALRLVAERGLTLPADLTLELLDELVRPGAPRALLGAVLDERAWALVRLNSAWLARLERAGSATRPLEGELWDTGTLAQRVAYLTAVRATDAAAGLALLESLAWTKETAEARESFLRALVTGLSAADEPFLERTLDDRAKSVRRVAADLLATLPDSAFLARAEALAATHLSRRRRLLRAPLTEGRGVPKTTQTTRDGYPADEPDSPAHDRARLVHVISLVPPGRWPTLLDATASALAAEPIDCDGAPLPLWGAWADAADCWGDTDLARVVVDANPGAAARLFRLLPPAEHAGRLTEVLLTAPGHYADLEASLTGPFDGGLTAALVGVAENWLGRGVETRWLLPRLVQRIALAGALDGADATAARLQALAERLPADERALRRSLGEGAAALQLRSALADALAPYPVLTAVHDPDEEG